MGITDTRGLETDDPDSNRQTSHRRSHSQGDWHPDSDTILAMSDDQQDIGNDIRRRERVAQACYET